MIVPLAPLTLREVQMVHESALRILRDTGMTVHSAKARERLAAHGANVCQGSDVVRFTENVVFDTLALVAPCYTMGGRTSAHDLKLTLDSGITRPIIGCNKIYDDDLHRRRDPLTADMVRAARLVDALPSFDCNAAFIYGIEEPPTTGDVFYFKLLLENTQKHICIHPYGPRNVEYMLEMASVVQGGREEISRHAILSLPMSPVTPLVWAEKFCDMIMVLAEAQVPMEMASTPMAGATTPATLAGSLVLAHAENLVGMMIAKACNPRAVACFAPRPSVMDMRSGISLWGALEWGIVSAAATQLARSLGIPTNSIGLGTDSKLPDQQTGIEKAFMAVLAFLSSPSMIAGGGFIDTISTGSLEQLVIDDEMITMARRVGRGIIVDADHLALDLIAKVGPGGSFLGEEHTRGHFREEFVQSKLADRQSYGTWETSGAKDIVARARGAVEDTLMRHEVPPLAADMERELDVIMSAARRELA
jgi:trimethylamine--corrinoid protein Co-methyltransferase